jgi:hypothetical protein
MLLTQLRYPDMQDARYEHLIELLEETDFVVAVVPPGSSVHTEYRSTYILEPDVPDVVFMAVLPSFADMILHKLHANITQPAFMAPRRNTSTWFDSQRRITALGKRCRRCVLLALSAGTSWHSSSSSSSPQRLLCRIQMDTATWVAKLLPSSLQHSGGELDNATECHQQQQPATAPAGLLPPKWLQHVQHALSLLWQGVAADYAGGSSSIDVLLVSFEAFNVLFAVMPLLVLLLLLRWLVPRMSRSQARRQAAARLARRSAQQAAPSSSSSSGAETSRANTQAAQCASTSAVHMQQWRPSRDAQLALTWPAGSERTGRRSSSSSSGGGGGGAGSGGGGSRGAAAASGGGLRERLLAAALRAAAKRHD